MKNILIILIVISFTSCRTVKKEWVKENYTSKQEAIALSDDLLKETKEQLRLTKETLSKDFDEKIKQATEKTTEKTDEKTTVSGTIEAEDGKEKSVVIGDTKITSNGATVNFETTSIKSFLAEYKTQVNELSSQLNEEKQTNEYLLHELNSVKTELKQLQQEINSETTTKSKDVNKSGLSFTTIILIVLVIILAVSAFVVYKKYKGYLFN